MTQEELTNYQSLQNILTERNLTALFQPIVCLKKQEIFGYEALIRGPSNSPLHAPNHLFDTAHRHDLLAELDLLCREIVIKQFAEHKLDAKLFINTTPAAMLKSGYPHHHMMLYLQDAGLSPEQVVIELTEQYPIEDYDEMRQAIDYYRTMGFSIAIDDLGAGYSGLRTWSELAPDFVKLDRHFMQNIHEDKQKRQFVSSMIDIAQSINCKVIGEGIEVRPEYISSQSLDIEFAQGYYFGRPERTPLSHLESGLFSERRKLSLVSAGRPRANTLVGSLLTQVLPVKLNDDVNHVGDRFQKNSNLMALPVVDDFNHVRGIVWRDELMTLYASRYGRELHGRKNIFQFMDASPVVVDKSMPLKKLSHRITSQEKQHQHNMFVITDNQHYVGMGSLIDLLRQITDLQISMARHANPLSGLPGNVPISEHIYDAIQSGRDLTVCYFDLDNFKPYNDIYGYSKGDRIITLTAQLLADAIDPELDFVGHVGGDDFIILFESENWQQRCQKILEAFEQIHTEVYQEHHIKDGGIKAQDRYGNETFYPLISMSIGAVSMTDCHGLLNESNLAEHASKAKSMAKRIHGNSLYQLDMAQCDCIQHTEYKQLAEA